jgi:hypothetical protein
MCTGVALAYAEDRPPSPYISKGACSFEGCAYGEWKVRKPTQVHTQPDLKSAVILELKPGDVATTSTGEVHVIPGLARMISGPYKDVVVFDPIELVYILDYLGEGYSRIYHKGKYLETKIARTKTECQKDPNWRRCWVEVLKEPVSDWWVLVQIRSGVEGWVLVEDGNLKVVDELSSLSSNRVAA